MEEANENPSGLGVLVGLLIAGAAGVAYYAYTQGYFGSEKNLSPSEQALKLIKESLLNLGLSADEADSAKVSDFSVATVPETLATEELGEVNVNRGDMLVLVDVTSKGGTIGIQYLVRSDFRSAVLVKD